MYSKGDLFEDFDNIWHEAVDALINMKENGISIFTMDCRNRNFIRSS